MASREYDVALSFAGEDRAYVHRVATILRDRGLSVFYDEFRTAELWGKDLYLYLDDVYRKQCEYAMVFTSENYARGMWTSHERQSIQSRLMEEQAGFLLLVQLDSTAVAGFRPSTGLLDGRRHTPEVVAEHMIAKVAKEPGVDLPAHSVRVPINADETRRILAIRPGGWEYLILAGASWQEWQRLAPKLLDHDLGFAAGTGQYVASEDVDSFLRASMDELTHLVSKLDRLVGGDRLVWATGDPGAAGDAARIQHLGWRFGTAVEDLLDWAVRIRATVCDTSYRQALELLASLADQPIRGVGDFVNDLVTVAGQISDAASSRATEGPAHSIRLDLALDTATLEAFQAEVAAFADRRMR